MSKSKLEALFVEKWKESVFADLVTILPEYQFLEDRKFSFDFALTHHKIAIEIEGSTWNGGRHTSGSGFAKDCEKYNLAASKGWRVFRLTSSMLKNDFKAFTEMLWEALGYADF